MSCFKMNYCRLRKGLFSILVREKSQVSFHTVEMVDLKVVTKV